MDGETSASKVNGDFIEDKGNLTSLKNEDFCVCLLYVFHFPSKASSLWLWLPQPGLSVTVADLQAIRF